MVCKCSNGQIVMVIMLLICYISKLIVFDVIVLKSNPKKCKISIEGWELYLITNQNLNNGTIRSLNYVQASYAIVEQCFFF
jgi:hypothetical protein